MVMNISSFGSCFGSCRFATLLCFFFNTFRPLYINEFWVLLFTKFGRLYEFPFLRLYSVRWLRFIRYFFKYSGMFSTFSILYKNFSVLKHILSLIGQITSNNHNSELDLSVNSSEIYGKTRTFGPSPICFISLFYLPRQTRKNSKKI